MVSYTRAKSEGLGFTTGTGMAAIGLLPREVRLVVLSLGLILAGIVGTGSTGGIVAPEPDPDGLVSSKSPWGSSPSVATITVIQRIIHVRQQAVTSDRK